MHTNKLNLKNLFYILIILFFSACNSGNNQHQNNINNDSLLVSQKNQNSSNSNIPIDTIGKNNSGEININKNDKSYSKVLIYNFHVTNRCPSCIAIEDATTKTVNKYFPNEVKSGRIIRKIVNVDDDANKTISEKYQAFGSGLFVTRVFNGKESTTELTGEGFKFAKNKEERFIEILKNKISEYLK